MHLVAQAPRRAIVVVAAIAALLTLATPAAADGAGGAVTDDSGIDYGAITSGEGASDQPAENVGHGSGPVCAYTLMGGPDGFPVLDLDGNLIETTAGGNWYQKTCDGVFYGAVYIVGPPDVVDPEFVAAGVLKRMNIPTPQVALSPTGDQIVNLPSWFWIPNWNTLTGTVTVGGITVRVEAQPSSARWSFGDGARSDCAPGVPWSSGSDGTQACTHIWLRSSAAQSRESYRLEVSVVWDASYTVDGGAGGGALPSLTRTTTARVRVAEVQAIHDRPGA